MKGICLIRDERDLWEEIAVYLRKANAALKCIDGLPSAEQILDFRPDLIITSSKAYNRMIQRLRRLPTIVVTEDPPPYVIEKKQGERNLRILHWPVTRTQLLGCTSKMLDVPPRISFKTLIRIFPEGDETGVIGQSLDFSTGGISFQTASVFSEGRRLFLSFNIPVAGESLRIAVRIVRSSAGDGKDMNVYGATFVDIGEKELRTMKEFVLGG